MSEPTFADHFSGHAAAYAAFRPRYPAALYDWLANVAPGRELAWDVGTGNGQVAHGLVTRFARVVATDPSSAQIAQAAPHPRIRYGISSYTSGLADASAQLVAVGQALHWFDLKPFFEEVRRVLPPSGTFAAFAYAHSRVSPEVDVWVREYHDVTLGKYWAPEHLLIHSGYRTLELPIDEIAPPSFELVEQWTLEQYLGFLRTWSSVQKLIGAGGEAAVLAFEDGLRERWGDAKVRPVLWPMVIRAGTVHLSALSPPRPSMPNKTPARSSTPSAHPVRDAADALYRAARESCHQHERLAKLHSNGAGEMELSAASEVAAIGDKFLGDQMAVYESVAAAGRGSESEEWWHAANALWMGAREYGRRQLGSDSVASRSKRHNAAQLGEITMEYELELSARLALKQAIAAYGALRPDAG